MTWKGGVDTERGIKERRLGGFRANTKTTRAERLGIKAEIVKRKGLGHTISLYSVSWRIPGRRAQNASTRPWNVAGIRLSSAVGFEALSESLATGVPFPPTMGS